MKKLKFLLVWKICFLLSWNWANASQKTPQTSLWISPKIAQLTLALICTSLITSGFVNAHVATTNYNENNNCGCDDASQGTCMQNGQANGLLFTFEGMTITGLSKIFDYSICYSDKTTLGRQLRSGWMPRVLRGTLENNQNLCGCGQVIPEHVSFPIPSCVTESSIVEKTGLANCYSSSSDYSVGCSQPVLRCDIHTNNLQDGDCLQVAMTLQGNLLTEGVINGLVSFQGDSYASGCVVGPDCSSCEPTAAPTPYHFTPKPTLKPIWSTPQPTHFTPSPSEPCLPTSKPSTAGPTATNSPTGKPSTAGPTATNSPTGKPSTAVPTATNSPTEKPSTSGPTATNSPTGKPSTAGPTATDSPIDEPTSHPTTVVPTRKPTGRPSTSKPTATDSPTDEPTSHPTKKPTGKPSTSKPTATDSPTDEPTSHPTRRPTEHPITLVPTRRPTEHPTTLVPTRRPTVHPVTLHPTDLPTTQIPTFKPSTLLPTPRPSTVVPTKLPTTLRPTPAPTCHMGCPVIIPGTDACVNYSQAKCKKEKKDCIWDPRNNKAYPWDNINVKKLPANTECLKSDLVSSFYCEIFKVVKRTTLVGAVVGCRSPMDLYFQGSSCACNAWGYGVWNGPDGTGVCIPLKAICGVACPNEHCQTGPLGGLSNGVTACYRKYPDNISPDAMTTSGSADLRTGKYFGLETELMVLTESKSIANVGSFDITSSNAGIYVTYYPGGDAAFGLDGRPTQPFSIQVSSNGGAWQTIATIEPGSYGDNANCHNELLEEFMSLSQYVGDNVQIRYYYQNPSEDPCNLATGYVIGPTSYRGMTPNN